MELELNTWTCASGIVREYITNTHELIGFTPRYNKQRRIVGGSYKGHADIASSWARELNDVQGYIEDGELFIVGGDADTKAEVHAVLAPLVEAHLSEIAAEQAETDEAEQVDITRVEKNHTGLELRCRREALGLSQNLAAKAFGATQAAWSRWEGGRRAVPSGVLLGVAALEDAMRAEVEAHLGELRIGRRRGVMSSRPVYLPNARVPEGIDQEVLAEVMGRVAAGRAYAIAWQEEGWAKRDLRIDDMSL